jgi:hypothetical protein
MHCVSAGRGVVLTTHPHLAPRLRMSRAIPLHPSRPMVACYRVTFTLPFTQLEEKVCDIKSYVKIYILLFYNSVFPV